MMTPPESNQALHWSQKFFWICVSIAILTFTVSHVWALWTGKAVSTEAGALKQTISGETENLAAAHDGLMEIRGELVRAQQSKDTTGLESIITRYDKLLESIGVSTARLSEQKVRLERLRTQGTYSYDVFDYSGGDYDYGYTYDYSTDRITRKPPNADPPAPK